MLSVEHMSHYQKREMLRFARNGDARRLSALLDKGAICDFVHSKTGMTPLMAAAYAGHMSIVQLLLAHGASPNLTADDGASALHWASRNEHLDIVQALIDAGANPNVRREEDGPGPLHFAIGNGHDSIARLLIRSGARKDITYLGRSVVEYAEWNKRSALAKSIR